MVVEIIIGAIAIILVIVAIIVYWFWKKVATVPVDLSKTIDKGMSKVSIKANRDLDEVILQDRAADEKLKFARNNVKAGETIEFIYPASMQKAHVVIRFDGNEEINHAEVT